MSCTKKHIALAVGAVALLAVVWDGGRHGRGQESGSQEGTDVLAGRFRWSTGGPLVEPLQRPGDFLYSVKDPSVVFYQGRWHLFCTVRGRERSHQIEQLTFDSWNGANSGRRQLLTMHKGFFCAPQVFYFRPHKRWYMICQASDPSWEPEYGAAFSTTDNIADPSSWSPLQPLGHRHANGKAGLDFWVICDDQRAWLFFTTLDGHMWREETRLDRFPRGWSAPELAVRGDIFEAGHVYRLKGLDRYLAVIEAQRGHGWRYYKAYLATRLDGQWTPLAASRDQCFASMANTTLEGPHWTDCISHGELIRAGYDERLEVDPQQLRFVFQGVTDAQRRGKKYGEIPWRLGILQAR